MMYLHLREFGDKLQRCREAYTWSMYMRVKSSFFIAQIISKNEKCRNSNMSDQQQKNNRINS